VKNKTKKQDKIRTKLDAYTVFEAIVIHIKVGSVSGAAADLCLKLFPLQESASICAFVVSSS